MTARTWFRWAAAALAAAAVTSCASSSTQTAGSPPAVHTLPAPSPTPPAAVAKISYSYTADFSLPSGIYDPVYLVGEIDVTNTGNIGVLVKCRMGWQLLGSPDITAVKRGKVAPGVMKALRYKVNAGSYSGNGGTVVDSIESWQNGHSSVPYGDDHCVITGTYGSAQ